VAAYYAHLQALPRRLRRALQRHWGVPLATLALWLALGQLHALAATIPVGGACTLVDAIAAANTDTATGGCPAGRGADTIILPPGSTQTLSTVDNDTFGPTGLPVVASVITIAGQGSTIRRAEGAPEFRLLAVRSTGDLTLQETRVTGGAGGGALSDYFNGGGGVANNGTLTLTNSIITGNVAVESCVPLEGISLCYSGVGGGVANNGTCTVTNSTITGNSTNGGFIAGSGGGMANTGTLTVTNSTITGNSAGNYGSGGGLDNIGTAAVTNSTISGNAADVGGGGVANNGTLTLTNSTISGNSTFDSAGGVANGGTLTITNSTLTGNTAHGPGGGVANSGTFTVTATFTNTSPTSLRVPFFEVSTLSGGNLLLNADAGPGGVGATLTPDVGDGVLAPGETVTADFVLGLQVRAPFTFVVELFGEPGP
jgi:hypothetical protein